MAKKFVAKKAEAKPKDPRAIKACVVADPMGHGFGAYTPEDEAKEIQETYEDVLGRKLDVTLTMSIADIPVGTEILFYDYGGMMPGSESLMESNARHLLRWAQDHPSALVIIVSSFTYRRYVRAEAEELGLVDPEETAGSMFDDAPKQPFTIPNVTVQDGNPEGAIPEWWKAGLK